MDTKQYANVAPIGLLAFGMTTILLNIHNAGFFAINASILAMGIFYGGLAQIVAGILEARKPASFAPVAFISYGFFWLSLVAIWVLPELGWTAAADNVSMGCYLALWGLFTVAMFIGTLNGNTIGKLVFGTLAILFILLAASKFTGNETLHTIAGYVGILCGALAFYEACALILNEKLERQLLPL